MIEPVIRVGNLKSLRTVANVRDAVRSYRMLVAVNLIGDEYYDIGGERVLEIGEVLNLIISISSLKDSISV